MRTLILSLLLSTIPILALADPVPTAVWDEATCSVIVSPNGHALDGWFICVSKPNEQTWPNYGVSLHHESENIECDLVRVEILDRRIIPLSSIFEDCSIVTSQESTSW